MQTEKVNQNYSPWFSLHGIESVKKHLKKNKSKNNEPLMQVKY